MLWKARSVLIVFPLVLLVAVFFATRSWFGDMAAAIAAVLVTVEPTLVAHGALVTTDMAVTAFLFTAVWMAIEFVRRPRWFWLMGAGLATGAALGSKHSAMVLPVILLVTMVAARMLAKEEAAISYRKLIGGWVMIWV